MTEPQRKRPTSLVAARLMIAVAAGFGATIACVAAATEPAGAQGADIHPLTSADPRGGPTTEEAGAPDSTPLVEGDAGAGDASKPDGGCPYGALEDPHRGFVRCLAQGERSPFADDGGTPPNDAGSADADAGDGASPLGDAGAAGTVSPGTDAGAPDAASPDAGPPPAPVPGPAPAVEMKTPKFENGDVPKAEKNLSGKKVLEAIAKCVADAGGLTGKSGSLKVEFLVRARGKAEGVEVKGQGVSEEAAKCVRNFLKNRSMGTPTADPTGVTVVYNLKPGGK